MSRLIEVNSYDDIIPEYRNTPVADLLSYHNLGREFEDYPTAQMLIGMCMDNRKMLRIPKNFAFILRTAGGNLRDCEFKLSFAVAVAKVKYIVMISHTQCAMVGLSKKRDNFINGLIENGGWDYKNAVEHFDHFSPLFEIDNEVDFVVRQAERLRAKYPRITFAPLHYKVEDDRLCIIGKE
jgi:carbonic anhydrase